MKEHDNTMPIYAEKIYNAKAIFLDACIDAVSVGLASPEFLRDLGDELAEDITSIVNGAEASAVADAYGTERREWGGDGVRGVDEAVSTPPYYLFPGGHEVRHISSHLTGNGAQALQYIARATRMDQWTKHQNAGLVEDLRKAKMFVDFEIERLEQAGIS